MSRAALTAIAWTFTILAWPAFALAQTAASRILVVPFENVTHNNRIVWLGEASAVLLADELNAGGVRAIDREGRLSAFRQLQVPPEAALTDATVIRIGQLVGASGVVVGSLKLENDMLTVRARLIQLEVAFVQTDVTEQGPIGDLFGIFERVAGELARSEGGASRPSARPHPPVAAFENYIKGLLTKTPGTAIQYFNAALRADATFDRARLALWDVYETQGDHQRALTAVSSVRPESEWSRRARFLGGLSRLQLQRYDEAFSTFKALADEQPMPAALNNLGVIQVRRGATPQTGLATYYFNKAAEADPTDSDFCFNLGYAYWTERDANAAIYWLREAVRRDPTDGDAHYVLGDALMAVGKAGESNRERELARRLSSTYADWERRPRADAVPKGLERVRDSFEPHRAVRIDDELATGGQRDQQELARFYLDRGRRFFVREQDREALAELNRALFLSPYLAEAHVLVGRIHLRSGQTREAIDAFKIALWSSETADAHALLAEAYFEGHDAEQARAEAERALAMDPASVAARGVLDRLATK